MIDILIYFMTWLISLYATIMLIYCLITFVIRDPNNGVRAALGKITEPPLRPIQRFLWRFEFFRRSPVDFSPVILFFLLRLVVGLLNQLALQF